MRDAQGARERTGGGRVVLLGTVALALALGIGLGVSAEAKKGGGSKRFTETKSVNAAIPPSPAPGQPDVPLRSEIKVPKKFKGKVVGDVNVTGIQTTGSAAGAADDLTFFLTAPNGRTALLFDRIGDQSIGPLTLDDDTSVSICDSATPPCADPSQSLNRPFAGTANLIGIGVLNGGPLSSFNGIKMRGTWTLSVFDGFGAATNSVLNGWGLRIKPAKPVSE